MSLREIEEVDIIAYSQPVMSGIDSRHVYLNKDYVGVTFSQGTSLRVPKYPDLEYPTI